MSMTQSPANSNGVTVASLFTNLPSAERSITELEKVGFLDEQIRIAVGDSAEQEALTEHTGVQALEETSPAATTGGFLSGLPHAFGEDSSLAGLFIEALVDMGLSEEQARYFEHGLESGNTLVIVNAGNRAADALAVLSSCGGDTGSGSVMPESVTDDPPGSAVILDDAESTSIFDSESFDALPRGMGGGGSVI
ncbi:MAG: general stress protein [Gemmatimonadaceae bacterium]|nr:general stress protein [Gloeobacterales cyanobacterium ES-bin-141]